MSRPILSILNLLLCRLLGNDLFGLLPVISKEKYSNSLAGYSVYVDDDYDGDAGLLLLGLCRYLVGLTADLNAPNNEDRYIELEEKESFVHVGTDELPKG